MIYAALIGSFFVGWILFTIWTITVAKNARIEINAIKVVSNEDDEGIARTGFDKDARQVPMIVNLCHCCL